MRTFWVVFLAILALIVGGIGGLVAGFSIGADSALQTKVEIACTVLSTAESAGHLSKEKRKELVDAFVQEFKDADKKASEADKKALEPVIGWARDRLDCAGY